MKALKSLKRSDDYLLRIIREVPLIVPVNWAVDSMPLILCPNEIGVFIWNLLSTERDVEEIMNIISSEYDVSDKSIKNDISEFIFHLVDAGAIINMSGQTHNSDIVGNDSKDFLYRIIEENFSEISLPISLTWELTHQCNLNCTHCYAKNCNRKNELSLMEIVEIIKQIEAEGCLQVIITGGEPFFRKDIFDVITELKKRGIFYILYTNGTLIDEKVVDFLAEYPPIKVELSIYGFTEQIYEKITQRKGSYGRFRNGLNLLSDRKIPLGLKTIAMKDNYHEIALMRNYAESLNVDFRFDPLITSSIDGLNSPISCRLSPKQIIELEKQNTISENDSIIKDDFSEQGFYRCGAGKYEANIDPYGQLSLCLLDRHPFYNLKQGLFKEGWKFINELRQMEYPIASPCLKCETRDFCKICPGWLKIEKQPLSGKVDFLCDVARERSLNPQRKEV